MKNLVENIIQEITTPIQNGYWNDDSFDSEAFEVEEQEVRKNIKALFDSDRSNIFARKVLEGINKCQWRHSGSLTFLKVFLEDPSTHYFSICTADKVELKWVNMAIQIFCDGKVLCPSQKTVEFTKIKI